MAPEQFEGNGASPRTDIWSLGIVLYEMAAGSRPFHGENLYRLCASIVRDAPPSLPPHTPPGLATVIHRCLEKEPARRYHSAGAVRAALDTLVSSSQSRVTTIHPKSSRSLRSPIAAAVVILLAIVGFFAFRAGYFGKRDPSVPSRILLGVLSSPNNGDETQSAFESGLVDTLNSRLGNLGAGNRLAVIPTSEMRSKHVTTVEAARQYWATYNWLGLYYQRHARHQEAAAMYSQVLSLAPEQCLRHGEKLLTRLLEQGIRDREFDLRRSSARSADIAHMIVRFAQNSLLDRQRTPLSYRRICAQP